MTYIQISSTRRAIALLAMIKTGTPVVCVAGKIYGVSDDHLKVLRRKRIHFKKLKSGEVKMPKQLLAV